MTHCFLTQTAPFCDAVVLQPPPLQHKNFNVLYSETIVIIIVIHNKLHFYYSNIFRNHIVLEMSAMLEEEMYSAHNSQINYLIN